MREELLRPYSGTGDDSQAGNRHVHAVSLAGRAATTGPGPIAKILVHPRGLAGFDETKGRN
jgi:hypothetical protein